jgi:hypothetical protein
VITPEIAGDVLLVMSAVPANAAVAVYSQVKWVRSAWGRHLMSYMLAVALVLDLGILRVAFGETLWFAWIRVGAYGLLVYALVWRVTILWAAHREMLAERSTDGVPEQHPEVQK